MGKIPLISLKLNFTSNTLDCYGLNDRIFLQTYLRRNDAYKKKYSSFTLKSALTTDNLKTRASRAAILYHLIF